MNTFKTGILMSLLTGLFLVVGALIGGAHRHAIAFVFAAGHQPVRLLEFRQDAVVACMARARWMPPARPNFIIWWSGWRRQAQSAHAQGLHLRKSPAQCLRHRPQSRTCRGVRHQRACWQRVNNEELAGVLAHELGHVRNRDTLTMTITAVIAGAIGMLANFAFFMGGDAATIRWAWSACCW